MRLRRQILTKEFTALHLDNFEDNNFQQEVKKVTELMKNSHKKTSIIEIRKADLRNLCFKLKQNDTKANVQILCGTFLTLATLA